MIFTPQSQEIKSLIANVCAKIASDSVTLWTVARQAPLSMGFSKQEYWSGLPCPPPGELTPALQADSLPLSHQEARWPTLYPY